MSRSSIHPQSVRTSSKRIHKPVAPPVLRHRWAVAISDAEWITYCRAIEIVRSAGIPFLLGGGFALAAYTGRWRDTKDIDLYVAPQDRDLTITALNQAGFADYYSRLPYDRKWIYRSIKDDMIVDIIWSMANQRAQVDNVWFEHARSITLRNQKLLVLPPEEFMWCKLYILQRDHCDWTDVFNLLYAVGPRMDWDHVLKRVGDEDIPLLRGLLSVYTWLCPKEALKLPAWLWDSVQLSRPKMPKHPPTHDHIRLLDSRGWFSARQKPGQKLEV
ncbi:MAG TPA: nucleotidyltransferase family protein [Clostridia bacterium]|nr:nucleotidyltransferase family protein [Clostridia bacterium]